MKTYSEKENSGWKEIQNVQLEKSTRKFYVGALVSSKRDRTKVEEKEWHPLNERSALMTPPT